MRSVRTILFSLLVLASSCDYFKERPQKFVGKFYFWNMDNGSQKSLYLKIGESNFSLIDLSGTVSTALGNDSLIDVKCDWQFNPDYHLIRHDSGEKIISVQNIDSQGFTKFEKEKKFKYSYYSK
jgi:hypothetical protein